MQRRLKSIARTTPSLNGANIGNTHTHTQAYLFPMVCKRLVGAKRAVAGSAPPPPRKPVLPTALEHPVTVYNPQFHVKENHLTHGVTHAMATQSKPAEMAERCEALGAAASATWWKPGRSGSRCPQTGHPTGQGNQTNPQANRGAQAWW